MEQMEKSTGRTIVRPVGKMRPLPIRRLGRTHMMAYCNTPINNVLSIYFVPPSIRHHMLFGDRHHPAYSLYSVGLLFTYLTQSTYTPSPKMNSYATGGKYGVASEAMLCSSIAELHRLHEFPPPAVVCHAMGCLLYTSDAADE